MRSKFWLLGVALCGAAACVPKPEQPAPQPKAPAPAPAPPAPPPASADWRDIALTPGNWTYGTTPEGSAARFGTAGASRFAVHCRRAERRVVLAIEGAHAGPMIVRTSSLARSLALSVQQQPIAASQAVLAASDPLLDAIAFSRGRFTVEVPGAPMIVIPAWPEPARVIEDCRS